MTNFASPWHELDQLEAQAPELVSKLENEHYFGLLVIVSIMGFFQGAIVPVSYELCAEMCYPISESVSSAMYQFCVNGGQLLFLLLPFVLEVSYFTFAMVLGLLLLFLVVAVILIPVSALPFGYQLQVDLPSLLLP